MSTSRWSLSVCAGVVLLLGILAGCSRNDNISTDNSNGISAPVDQPQNLDIASVDYKPVLLLGGVNGSGVLDPKCEYTVTVYYRDAQNNLIGLQGATVELRWWKEGYPNRSFCLPVSPLPATGQTSGLDPVDNFYEMSNTTAADGKARFRLSGYSTSASGCPGAGDEGTQIRTFLYVTPPGGGGSLFFVGPYFATPRLNGSDGVNGADQSVLLNDQFCGGTYFSRSDLNGDHVTNSVDLSIYLGIHFGAGSILAPTVCQ